MSEKGKIIEYNSRTGTGFIERDGKRDVHFGNNSFSGSPPSKGSIVEFDVIEQQRGPHALKIRVLSEAISEISATNYMLPKDTRKIIDAKDIENIDNFALRLNKVPFYNFHDNKFELFKTDRKRIVINVQPKYSKSIIKSIADKYKQNLENLCMKVKTIKFSPAWRIAIGLGNKSVYETSMTLHHVYGIPYIPGSALKGVIRSFLIQEEFEKSEDNALKDQGFCDIFGCPKKSYYKESKQGRVFFFDVFPISEPKIKPDVMNPHYGPYYSGKGKTPPADYHNPKPIFFLTVENTQFEFMVGIKQKYEDHIIQSGRFKGKHLLTIASEWMVKALKEHGIGAKTAVGYGYFNEPSGGG